jgi:undecaprenyl-diphosphatase
LKIWELVSGDASVDWLSLALGVAVSGISAYACIASFLRFIDKVGFMPFVYYRIALVLALYLLWLK